MTVTADGRGVASLADGGGAAANTAADQIRVTTLALNQIPDHERHRQLLNDCAGASKDPLGHLHILRTDHGLELDFSVAFTLREQVQDVILALPEYAWAPAAQIDGSLRETPTSPS